MRALSLVPLLLAAPLLAGCVSDDQWSFPLTRSIYGNEDSFESYGSVLGDDFGASEEGPLIVLAVLILPLAIDLVILPVTGPRDLIVLGG